MTPWQRIAVGAAALCFAAGTILGLELRRSIERLADAIERWRVQQTMPKLSSQWQTDGTTEELSMQQGVGQDFREFMHEGFLRELEAKKVKPPKETAR